MSSRMRSQSQMRWKLAIAMLFISMATLTACNKQNFEVQAKNEDFAQVAAYNSKVDVLLMVDVSGSMAPYRQRFLNQAPAFINELNRLGMDYRIGVTTSDFSLGGGGGLLVGQPKVLTPQTPNLIENLRSRMQLSSPGNTSEWGLEAVREVLKKEAVQFLRDDALLVVIYMSDEDDQSDERNGARPKDYIDFFNSIKKPFQTGAQSWVAHLIGVTDISEANHCQSGEVAVRYIEVVKASGGRVEALCSGQMASTLENIRIQIFQLLTDYHLDQEPRQDSIHVFVNDVELAKDSVNGWSYEIQGVKKLVRFHGKGVPGAKDRIRVSFTPLSAG